MREAGILDAALLERSAPVEKGFIRLVGETFGGGSRALDAQPVSSGVDLGEEYSIGNVFMLEVGF